MENKEPEINHNADNSDSSDNFSYDEWTIIGKNYANKDEDTDDRDNYNDLINKDQEFSEGVERGVEVIVPQDDHEIDDETEIVVAEKHCEDSDGISVITESETEQMTSNKKFSENNRCRNYLCSDLKTYEKSEDRTVPQAGTILNIVMACSLAAVVGLGAGRLLGMDDKCSVTSAIDFSTIKMESNMLIDQIRELSEVKNVLDEIKASIPQVKRKQGKKSQRDSKSNSKKFEKLQDLSIISDSYIFDPDTTILEQLQNSLNTLCSVIDNMNPENDFIKSDTTRTQKVVADLIEFKQIIHNIVKELGNAEGQPKEFEFLRHAEKRIRNVCESLLSDLSYTIHGMTTKIHHKLNKVRHKLNKRLCMLKKSEWTDDKIFKSLKESDNSFLESCDNILNVTSEANPKSVKRSRMENASKNIDSKKEQIPSSESENDAYPKDSGSDSSMPDFTYNSKTNNIWRKKVKSKRQAEQNSEKIFSVNIVKRRKIRGDKIAKPEKARSLKKLMTEVFIPPTTCPLNEEYWLESISVTYPETQKLDQSPIDEKPLYSAVLKSDINAATSELTPKTVKKIDQHLRVLAKENLTETKHNVTPAESGINDFEIAKSIKEQLNKKIWKPVERDDETLESEEISTEKYKDITASVKHCRKGKKCSVYSSITTESSKTIESNKKNRDGSERNTKSGTEKNVNKKYKKVPKNEKYTKDEEVNFEEKLSFTSKSTGTKKHKGFKKPSNTKKVDDDQLNGEWQLQRSRAREMHRDHNHRSEWFFDRADSRQDARKNMDVRKCNRKDKCEPLFEEKVNDEEFYNSWKAAKDVNDQKHSKGRAAFVSKKLAKMPHRKNIMQSKRR